MVNLIRRQKIKFTDLLNILQFVYTILAPLIFPAVSMPFSNSLSKGIFLEYFNMVIIIPIAKSGD